MLTHMTSQHTDLLLYIFLTCYTAVLQLTMPLNFNLKYVTGSILASAGRTFPPNPIKSAHKNNEITHLKRSN